MDNKKWIRLDNASNIFVAARNDTDTKVFRLTAVMKEKVNESFLQQALITTYNEYPLFHNVLRRGFFWYYLEPIDRLPKIQLETTPPCSQIYHYDKREFLFRVLYRDNQIHLEVFHALTDGTGALWFFEDLLTNYINMYQADDKIFLDYKRRKEDLEDSFKRYFQKKIQLFPQTFAKEKVKKKKSFYKKSTRTHQISGTRTPDHRLRIIKLNLPVDSMLSLAREENVSLTIYLAALYMLSVYEVADQSKKQKDMRISISIPINLRQFFPSLSVRNFFSTTTLSYKFKPFGENSSLAEISQELNVQFQKQLEVEEIENKIQKFIQFEYNPFIRVVLRPIKDFILKIINYFNNQSITIAMSNLGLIQINEELVSHIDNFYFYTSVIRPQFCMLSYGNSLNISFTSPFVETDIYQKFVSILADKGIDIEVDVNKVTPEEMGD